MMTKQEQERLAEAAARLLANPDFNLVLTTLKNECIQDFKQIDASEEQICEAHRRYKVADELENRITTYGRTANSQDPA